MGCRDIDEFARSDDLRAFPVGGEMLLISGNQVVSTGSICAFDEDVVVRVASDSKLSRWRDGMAMILDELNELLPRPLRIASSDRPSTSAYSSRIGVEI